VAQIGFEPKLAFLCPLCNREVEIVYERAKDDWVSEHSGCVNFSVIRSLPQLAGIQMPGPLVFIVLESDFSVKEAAEGLRALSREEKDTTKKQKLEAGAKRIESKLGTSEKNLSRLVDTLKSGAFGLKIVSGREVSSLVWRSGQRFFGVADGGHPSQIGGGGVAYDALVATDSAEEAKQFILHWLNYWGERMA